MTGQQQILCMGMMSILALCPQAPASLLVYGRSMRLALDCVEIATTFVPVAVSFEPPRLTPPDSVTTAGLLNMPLMD
jgi:hypothetical protein